MKAGSILPKATPNGFDEATYRARWDSVFTQVMIARRIGEMSSGRATAIVADFITFGVTLADMIEPIDDALAIIAAAKAILEAGRGKTVAAAGTAECS